MINYNTVALKIFKVLKGHGYNIKVYTPEGVETVDPEEGRWFFVKEPNMMIALEEELDEIKVNKNSTLSLEVFEKVLKQIKAIANHYILNFTIRNFAKNIEPKDLSYQGKKKKKEKEQMEQMIGESYICEDIKFKVITDRDMGTVDSPEEAVDLVRKYMYVTRPESHVDKLNNGETTYITYGHTTARIEPIVESSFSRMRGSSKTSTQALEGVKLIIKHSKPVSEEVRGSRSRNIKSIFIENNGERTKFKYNNMNGARALARHIQNGGSYGDDLAEHIISLTGKILKLNEFYKYAKDNQLINESSSEVIEVVKENIRQYVSELKNFSGSKSYFIAKSVFESEERVISEQSDVNYLKDMFTIKHFNEQFEEIMPLLDGMVTMNRNKMIRIKEAASQPILICGTPLVEDAIVEYSSKSAKLGNRLLSLSGVIVDNAELVEFIVKVGKKLIAEEKTTQFENMVVSEVISNVYTKPKKKGKKKDVVESIVENLSLKLGKYEYPTLMESALKFEHVSNMSEAAYLEEVDEDEATNWDEVVSDMQDIKSRLIAMAPKIQQMKASLGESVVVEWNYAGSTAQLSNSYVKAIVDGYEEAKRQWVAANRGISIANTLKDPESRKKHKSRIFITKNRLNSIVNRLERGVKNLER